MKALHQHGLGPDFEKLLRAQLKLDEQWQISRSGVEEVEREEKREGIVMRERQTVVFCDIEASENLKEEVLAQACCPACGGPLRKRGEREQRAWQHLSVLGQPFEVRARLMRLHCPDGGNRGQAPIKTV